jgi:2-amino-4-hydroxy-6-hydroxymethyldihydropteridine diphosphokinase
MTIVYLLTGSNIGNSLGYLQQARSGIVSKVGEVVTASSIYKTEPWGKKDQQDFLNQVLEVKTNLSPQDVLHTILAIELEMGRNRIEKWGPRVIDIDLLFYGNLVLNTQRLTIPHPLLHERRFTLLPLAEIAPTFNHPVFNQPINELLRDCPDTSTVDRLP